MAFVTSAGRAKLGACLLGGLGAGALVVGLATADRASAGIGYSYANIPGIVGGARNGEFRDWLQIESHYWTNLAPPAGRGGRGGGGGFGPGRFYPQSGAPTGVGELALAVSKKSPGLARMMALCKSQAPIPELTFAESSFNSQEMVVPAGIPKFYRYKLGNVVVRACGIDAEAPEQVLILKFDKIDWLNFKPGTQVENPLPASVLAPLDPGGNAMTFAIHWVGIAGYVSDDQCDKDNDKPAQSEYYRLMDPAEAAKEKPINDAKGGVSLEGGQMEWRGPNKTNVARLPGIVRDPGHFLVRSPIARGLDLDGNDGTGPVPAGVCPHRNFVSEDGRKGIDNQLFRVQGCIEGYRGEKGFYHQYQNEQRRNRSSTQLIQISGIDDLRNDSRVQVTLVYSRDPMAKSADGTKILPHYTFRVADDPSLNFYANRVTGRIENGVIITDPTPELRLNAISSGAFHQGRLRLEITPEGNLKGIATGYQDIRKVLALASGSNQEQLYHLTTPGHYNAMRREADGLKDPVTGQCWGISSVFDIQGSRAFVSPVTTRYTLAKDTKFALRPGEGPQPRPLASAR